MSTVPKISQAEWDKHKDRLYALYITENLKLEEVVERAKCELGFVARFVYFSIDPLFGCGSLTIVAVRLNIQESSERRSGISRRT